MTSGLLLIAISYLAGSIPFGYLLGRLVRGIDIRAHGSGNIGATNVGRVLGNRWGACALLLDLCKGLLPAGLLARAMISRESPDLVHWQVAAGMATIAGHMFPVWLGFRGGKGVATGLGVVLCLAPWASLAAATLFALSYAAWRIVSLSSLISSIGFGIVEIWSLLPEPFSSSHWSLAIFSLLVPALIVARHRANIGRLLQGTETRYSSRRDPASPGQSATGKAGQQPGGLEPDGTGPDDPESQDGPDAKV